MTVAFKQLMSLIVLFIEGFSNIAIAFSNITAVAAASSGEYKDDAEHQRSLRVEERTKLLNQP